MGQVHPPPPEALEVGETRMRADADALFHRQPHRPRHHVRVARMEAAGHVGRGHDVEKRGIVAHDPGPEAFAHVRVQIDLHGSSSPAVTPLTS